MEHISEYHVDKEGNKKKISDLKTSHIENIIRCFEKIAEEGYDRRIPYQAEPDTHHGEEALKYLNYYAYVEELSRRKEADK